MDEVTTSLISLTLIASSRTALLACVVLGLTACQPDSPATRASATANPAAASAPSETVASGAAQPTVAPASVDVYAHTQATALDPSVRDDLNRVYVPHVRSDDVYVIDPKTLKVIHRFKVGRDPQHIVPSWDLRTLWVANNAERHDDGSLTPIDPRTGKAGTAIPVDDPYNLYFTPDGKSAIVVAEARKRLDFRDPQSFALQYSIDTPLCGGINHADFSPDGKTALFTCEFDGTVTKINLERRQVEATLKLKVPETRFKIPAKGQPFDPSQTEICSAKKGMPQDIRISPDGRRYYVADMMVDGVHVIDAATFQEVGFIPTGPGAHGLYPSRDGQRLYVANRGSHKVHGPPKGPGGVTVIDFATEKVVAQWGVPGGGSPDMGNVSADGHHLWLAGRYDDQVYRFDTRTGAVDKIKVGAEPHGLTVWPLPGRYSLGHTGNLR